MEKEKRPVGRPAGKNYEILKRIRINEAQDKNWNRGTSKLIRDLLEGKLVPIELLKQLYSIMDTKMTPKEKLTAEEMEYITEIMKVLKVE